MGSGKSVWADYAVTNTYSEKDQERKVTFVREVVHSRFWELTYDLGSNTGAFLELLRKTLDMLWLWTQISWLWSDYSRH